MLGRSGERKRLRRICKESSTSNNQRNSMMHRHFRHKASSHRLHVRTGPNGMMGSIGSKEEGYCNIEH